MLKIITTSLILRLLLFGTSKMLAPARSRINERCDISPKAGSPAETIMKQLKTVYESNPKPKDENPTE